MVRSGAAGSSRSGTSDSCLFAWAYVMKQHRARLVLTVVLFTPLTGLALGSLPVTVSRTGAVAQEKTDSKKKAVKPTRVPIRLLDAQGQPVPGAVAATFFWRDVDRGPSYEVPDGVESATSDEKGEPLPPFARGGN